MKINFIQGKEGKWYKIVDGHFTNVCCGCGMEHRIEVMVDKRDMKVGMRFFLIKERKGSKNISAKK